MEEGLAIGGIILVLILAIALGVLPMIFYLINQSNLLKQCAPENRKMDPNQVWLVLIPIFGIVWHFMMIGYISDSVAAEYHARGMRPKEEKPGYNLGLIALILMLVCGLPGIVCWIIYWVKMAEYKNELINSAPTGMRM
jgi:hypothetical protein